MNVIRLLIILSILVLYGCSPSPTVINATLNASNDVNPDLSDRPSPIVVRVYELKSLGTFEAADFYSLFDNPEAILGSDLINSAQFHLNPGDTQIYNQTTSPETNYVAVTAAYRKLNLAIWRDHMVIPTEKTTDIIIYLEKLNVSIMKKAK
ncbi:MAG: type VI secretion system lipoprotein TssJ [Gammaproteobacteria bacterium]|nr:type VI secretion system lipoprotein TssJ [Gammaproteobacteria bacterium]